MAVKIKVGEVYTEIKTGVSAKKGKWGCAVARAEKGYDRITIWFTNPEDIPDDTYAVRLVEITESYTENKEVNGKWYTQYNARARVEAVEGGAVATELNEEGDLPF